MPPSALVVFLAIFSLPFSHIARCFCRRAKCRPSRQRKTISKIHTKSFGTYYFTITCRVEKAKVFSTLTGLLQYSA